MGWFKKKLDPLSARERELERKLAELTAQIAEIDPKKRGAPQPRLRPATFPSAAPRQPPHPAPEPPRAPAPAEPVFERVDLEHTKRVETALTKDHFNDQGLQKYDLVAALRRARAFLTRTEAPTSNPKLIKFLAVGRVDGLKPLRVEKRVARRRFIALFVILLLLLLGIVSVFMRAH